MSAINYWIDGLKVKTGYNIAFSYMSEENGKFFNTSVTGIIKDIVEDINDYQYINLQGSNVYYCTQYFVRDSLKFLSEV